MVLDCEMYPWAETNMAYTFLQAGKLHISYLSSRNCHPLRRQVVSGRSRLIHRAVAEIECTVPMQPC